MSAFAGWNWQYRTEPVTTRLTWALALLLSGCSTIDYSRQPPADWPVLQERIVHDFSMTQQCAGALFPITVSFGCALISFVNGTCTIYLASDAPEVLVHERAHCAGYDHVGASSARDAWVAFKAWMALR